jgi:glycosyltransferase involved in cell wall biosynthesis
MRILHAVLSEGFYGSERYCIELACEQAREGHDVLVVTLGTRSPCTQAARAAFTGLHLRSGGRLRLRPIPGSLPAFLHRPLGQLALRRFRPEIVHTHLDPAARRIGRVARALGVPHIATLHLNFSAREYGACDGLVLIANWQRRNVPHDFAGLVTVVHNWLPASVAQALRKVTDDEVARLRHEWGDDKTFVFGTVGRLVPEKGVDILVRAFRRAFPQPDAPVRLVIVGGGPERAALQELADSDSRIFFAGARPDVAVFYRAFDAYVSPARFEPFGIAILEAMAAGCPLVLTRSEGPIEFVDDAQALWVADTSDAALASALTKTQAGGRRRIAYALDNFSPARASAEIEQFYNRVLARHALQKS